MQVSGHVLVVYNMGTTDHRVSDTSTFVNDNTYHVIRFRRSEANSTLQVDERPPVLKTPTGELNKREFS